MDASAPQDPLIALVPEIDGQRRLGPCRVLNRVGAGAMGLVYKGHHNKLDIDVAIKVMAPHLAGDAAAVSRFTREAQIVAKIRHPNLVQIYDVDSAYGLHYIILEWIEGRSAQEELKQVGKFPLDQALQVARQAALGLAAAHEKGYIHRDIKPANLQLGTNGEVKVVDLGVAKVLQEGNSEGGLTATGATVGTPAFMSPEQCQDASTCGPPSDVYSLGATLFTLLTGKPPFEGKNIFEILTQVVGKPFPALPAELQAPPPVVALLQKATAKTPTERYAAAGQFADALADALAAVLGSAAPDSGRLSAVAAAYRPPSAGGRTTKMAFESDTQTPALAADAPAGALAAEPAAPAVDGDAIWEEAKQAERAGDPEKSWALLEAGARQLPGHYELNFRAADLALKQKWKDRFETATAFAQIAVDLGEKDRDQSYNARRVLAGLQALKRSLEQFEKYIQLCDQHYRELRIDSMKQPLSEAENLQPKHPEMERMRAQYDAGRAFEDNYIQWQQRAGNEQWAEALAPVQQMDAFTISHGNPAVSKAFGYVRQLTQALAGMAPVSPDGSFVMELSHLAKPGQLLLKADGFRQQAVTTAFKRLRDFVQNNGDLAVARKTIAGLRPWADRNDKRLAAFEDWFAKVEQSRAGRAPGEMIARFAGYGSWVHLCGFAPDGSVLATGSDDHKVYLHDIPAGVEKQVIDVGRKAHITVLEVTRGQRVAAVGLSNGELHQYDLDSGGETARTAGSGLGRLFGLGGGRCFYPGHSGEIAQVRFSPDGLKLLSAALDKSIRLWDAFNGQELQRINDCKQPPVGLDFDLTGSGAYVADDKGVVFLLDLNGGAVKSQFATNRALKKAVFGVSQAILLDTHGKVSLWNLSKGKQTAEVAVKGAAVQDLVLTPARDAFLTVGRETVARLWRSETGQAIGEFTGHAAALRSAAFSDNGRWLATYGMQGEARVWETTTGNLMYVLKGHTGLILKACFSSDQRWIATVSEDNSARVWSAGLPPDAPRV